MTRTALYCILAGVGLWVAYVIKTDDPQIRAAVEAKYKAQAECERMGWQFKQVRSGYFACRP